MLAPLWLALSASLALHIGVLLSPGWALPFDDEPETSAKLSARLAPPQSAPVTPHPPAVPGPAKKKPPAQKPAPPPASEQGPVTPDLNSPNEPSSAAAVPAPVVHEPVPEWLPSETLSQANDAVTPTPSFATRWPRTGRIVFRVTRGEQDFVIGQGEHRWEHDDHQYRLQATTETTGLVALFRSVKVVQESRGGFDAAGLRPHEFTVVREGKTTESIHFDAAAGNILLPRGGSVAFVPAQDMLSLFYQMAHLPGYSTEHALRLATARGVASYTVQVGIVDALETPLGTRQAIHFKVVGGRQEDRTEVWLDAETRLPLRIRHRDRKGDLFDQIAITIETETKP